VDAKDVILTISIMLAAGLAAEIFAAHVRLPKMLVLLAVGTVLGPSVTGAIDVPLDSTGAELLLTLGVSIVLFYGGLGLSAKVLSPVALGLGLLVIPGVILTGTVVGLVAASVFHLPFWSGLLIGMVLAPTDPAILIPLFEKLGLRPKLKQAIIAESALNDPTGAVAALAVAGIVLSGHYSLDNTLVQFVNELGISTGLGIIFGLATAFAISKGMADVWGEPVSLVVVALGAVGFYSLDFAGGSGYLGAFVSGLIVGNMRLLQIEMHEQNERELRTFVAIGADVMVMLLFLTLGSNLPWAEMRDHALPALAVVGTLLFVARPLAVLACLLPDRRGRWTRAELVFMGWARETGAMPAALAGLMVGMGVVHADLIVTCVAFAIVATLVIQSTTKPWLARRLKLLEDGESAVKPADTDSAAAPDRIAPPPMPAT
jgi:potassium/hydrogen antiporter